MAWHILHGLLEQVRRQSTFPGKLWIVTMFVFRILVVARIGEHVYHDEQSSFVCNTLTPGCTNVCFNRFSPISQLRYWSLMVLVVATPTIFFFLYAMHAVYHADMKFPYKESEKRNDLNTAEQHKKIFDSTHFPKRRKNVDSDVQPPLYVVTKIPKSGDSGKRFGRFLRKRRRAEGDALLKKSVSDNNASDVFRDRPECRPYAESHCRHVGLLDGRRSAEQEAAIRERKYRSKMLQHPELARAYWWHVLLRTITEVAFMVGQYYLYGFEVSELYECTAWPCPKAVDCFVSRPREKSCLLWIMYGLGAVACALSLAEFVTLGFSNLANAFVCCSDEPYEQRRRRLAKLLVSTPPKPAQKPTLRHEHHMTRKLSMGSISSDTTVESV